MTSHSLMFDAVAEIGPGPKWRARWDRSWPAYRAWFIRNGGEAGPSRTKCEAALTEYMPELLPVYQKLVQLAGDDDLAARFLSTWCPPRYLGGCSLAAVADGDTVRLVRNYDLSPDLNEGLLLRSEWTGMPVMGMIEFLWGLSDGVNAAGLSVALAYGGRDEVARGFGVTTILRYVLETCSTVEEAMAVLDRVPSHMAYNIVLADREGTTAVVELSPGGGTRCVTPAIATNHQTGVKTGGREAFDRSRERLVHLGELLDDGIKPDALGDAFLAAPLHQRGYVEGFGTLFTAVYDPQAGELVLRWPDENWAQTLDRFVEGQREIRYDGNSYATRFDADFSMDPMIFAMRPYLSPDSAKNLDRWCKEGARGHVDWADLGSILAGASTCRIEMGKCC